MLKVNNLSLERGGRKLFERISFHVSGGQVLQIKGANGSGKSSLLQVLAGDLKPTSGEVLIDGKSKIDLISLTQKLGYLPQELAIDFPISVFDFLQMAKPKVDLGPVLTRFELEELQDKKMTELSLGQIQRVQIAQIVFQDPEIYLLDEPFSAQDQEHIQLILRILSELKTSGKSVLLTNHIDMNLNSLIDLELNL